jgi:hypothetical protein
VACEVPAPDDAVDVDVARRGDSELLQYVDRKPGNG